jgi:hypothetical protein
MEKDGNLANECPNKVISYSDADEETYEDAGSTMNAHVFTNDKTGTDTHPVVAENSPRLERNAAREVNRQSGSADESYAEANGFAEEDKLTNTNYRESVQNLMHGNPHEISGVSVDDRTDMNIARDSDGVAVHTNAGELVRKSRNLRNDRPSVKPMYMRSPIDSEQFIF